MLGWTQQEIADIVGLAQKQISNVSNNFNTKEITNSFQKGKPELLSNYS